MALAASPAACRRARGGPFLTHFEAAHGLSLRYPADWHTEQATRQDVWYRYFLPSSAAGPQGRPALSVMMLVARLQGSLDEYAQAYLAGATVSSSRPESRAGAAGVALEYTSEGGRRHRLLLLQDGGSAYGLHAEGDAPAFEREGPRIAEMFASFALERPAAYAEHRDAPGAFSIRLPSSWKATRTLGSGDRRVAQFLGPPMRLSRDRQTIHPSLTVSVESLAGAATHEGFHAAARERLGSAYQLLDHVRWQDGYADVMRAETPMAASRLRRFYRVSAGRGYSLSFEADEDLFQDVVAWFDLIAGTFQAGALPGAAP